MIIKPKIWLCGIVQNCVKDADEITADIYEFFDGLIFVDHLSTDGTKELLESRKKEGEIISIQWMNHHGWSMQAILNSSKILPGDWFIICDSLERISPIFAQNISNHINNFESGNIHTIFLYGKILMAKYNSEMRFSCVTPHCYLTNWQLEAIDFANSSFWKDEQQSRYNIRPQRREKHHFIDHFVKYSFQYVKNSNQMVCGRESNPEEIREHETRRQQFIIYANRVLEIDLTVDALKKYIQNHELDDYTKSYFNFERYFNDFYRFYVLKHNLDDIIKDGQEKKLFEIK